jgi:alpha-L-fucosidase
MKLRSRLPWVILAAVWALAGPGQTIADPATESAEQKDARMRWWREARFGMFIHWGLYSVPAGEWKGQRMPEIGEWIMSKYRIPITEYSQLTQRFNPIKFDANAVVSLAKDAGMRYVVITAKHHDGFAMYHSTNDGYNIYDATLFKRDPVAELAAACRKQDLKMGIYYSQALDWHEHDAGGTEPGTSLNGGGMHWGNDWDFPDQTTKKYQRYFDRKVKPQLTELMTRYGPFGVVWFDTPFTIKRAQSEELYTLVRGYQPGAVMNSRLGNGLGDYQSSGDNEIPVNGKTRDWETPATINDTWGFKSFDDHWKTPQALIRNLIDIVSKGGNYLLNIGPTAEGEVPAPIVERLRAMGQWLRTNGEAIYGTKAGPLQNLGWARTTQKGDTLYLHVFVWPKDGIARLPFNGELRSVALLASPSESLKYAVRNGGLEIQVPAVMPDPSATVLVLEKEKL